MSDGDRAEPEALRAAMRELELRLAALGPTTATRTEVERALGEMREARRRDRWRAIDLSGARTRRVGICARATETTSARPRRCPGCDVPVVDPRGLDRHAIARRMGTAQGWLARADGLIATRECDPLVRARAGRRWLASAMSVSVALGFVIGRLLTLGA